MLIRYLFALSLVTLSACQSNRLMELDYLPEHNYHDLQSWQWAEPAIKFEPDTPQYTSDLDAQRVRKAITEQLTQQGLTYSTTAPIQVRAWLLHETQQQRSDVQQNSYWSPIWGPNLRTESYDITQHLQKLQIDFVDSSSQKLIWRGSNSWVLPQQRTHPEARQATLREQVEYILQHFPPE